MTDLLLRTLAFILLVSLEKQATNKRKKNWGQIPFLPHSKFPGGRHYSFYFYASETQKLGQAAYPKSASTLGIFLKIVWPSCHLSFSQRHECIEIVFFDQIDHICRLTNGSWQPKCWGAIKCGEDHCELGSGWGSPAPSSCLETRDPTASTYNSSKGVVM